MIAVFYALWVQFGGLPKVRHLLPLMPPLMLLVAVAALKVEGAARPLALAMALSIALQVAGQGVFTRNHMVRWVAGEDKSAFLARMLGDEYGPVQWINTHSDRIGRLLLFERHLLYLIDVPTTVVHYLTAPVIETRDGRVRADSLYAKVRDLGLTHILDDHEEESPRPGTFSHGLMRLGELGCLERVISFDIRRIQSLTLRMANIEPVRKTIWRLTPGTCGI